MEDSFQKMPAMRAEGGLAAMKQKPYGF